MVVFQFIQNEKFDYSIQKLNKKFELRISIRILEYDPESYICSGKSPLDSAAVASTPKFHSYTQIIVVVNCL